MAEGFPQSALASFSSPLVDAEVFVTVEGADVTMTVGFSRLLIPQASSCVFYVTKLSNGGLVEG